ncbi:PAS domain S-box protein [Siphonobacter sp. SORGH_AS_0500]|uniref:PAS domain S-box protein n=1 Tax=Siphonobacter sp. SORGH_AS_0500 TaxID=1864824 RepID=UPI002861BD48|nr:PAS domain S-box protein [Siphonobacter sp. SORGH_AS_0500]MDR6193332.1 PAS domain S-box-containing protein [Siphonobacter sp. SORGH_AS_0500]
MSRESSASLVHHPFSSFEELSIALKAARVGIWSLDIESQQVRWDDRCQEIFGTSGAYTIAYQELLKFIHPEDRRQVDEALIWALNPASQGNYEVEFRTCPAANQPQRWLRCIGKVYIEREVTRFSGMAQETTAIVESRKQLEASERHWRSLVDHSATATAIYQGREMRIQAVNQAMINIWGKDESVRGKTFDEAIPEVAEQPFLTLLQGVYDTGVAYYTPEGPAMLEVKGRLQEFWFTYSYVPLKSESGQVYGIIHTATDITQQVQARRALEIQQEQFKALMEGSLLLKCILTPQGTFTFQNHRYGEYTGLSLEQSKQKGWQSLLYPEDLQNLSYHILQGFLSQQTFSFEGRLLSGKGDYCWHEIEFVALLDENKELSGWVFRATNIHEQKTLQQQLEYLVQERTEELEASLEELQALNEELVASNEELRATSDELSQKSLMLEESNGALQERSEALGALNEELQATTEELGEYNQQLSLSNERLQRFAYVASHDLQEPLRKIQTFGSLVIQKYGDPLGEQGLSFLNRISKAGEQMSTLIQDLLTYSRMTGGQNPFQVVSLQQIIAQVMDMLELPIEQTKAMIEIETLPAIMGDEFQLSQLFQNLLSNALKFSKQGQSPQVRISARIIRRNQLPIAVKPLSKVDRFHQISVMDQGIGFDEQFLDRIFEVFQRLHSKQEFSGTGIGLSICQRVMENHLGAITAESRLGQGASFHVYFPG